MSKDYADLNLYQNRALSTAVFTRCDYPLAALGEEVGEVLGKIAKHGRKNDMSVEEVIIGISAPRTEDEEKLRVAIKKEMGDVLWQWSVLAYVLGLAPSEIAEENLSKLSDRQQRNVLNGEGDNR